MNSRIFRLGSCISARTVAADTVLATSSHFFPFLSYCTTSLSKTQLNNCPVFFDGTKLWAIGRIHCFRDNVYLIGPVPLQDQLGVMAGCQIGPKDNFFGKTRLSKHSVLYRSVTIVCPVTYGTVFFPQLQIAYRTIAFFANLSANTN